MFGPDSGKGKWSGLNFMFEKVRIGSSDRCQQRLQSLLQVRQPTVAPSPDGNKPNVF